MSPSVKIFGWGFCEDNQLGLRGVESQPTSSPPIQIPIRDRKSIVRLACGYKHSLLLTQNGEVHSCGSNEFGQLGFVGNQITSGFSQIEALANQVISDVACGAYHNAAVSHSGRLFTWGANTNGQLGREGDDPRVKLVQALLQHRVVQVSLGVEHSLVLTDTSQLFVFGSNAWGQLGLAQSPPPSLSIAIPTRLDCLAHLPIRQICAGGYHSALLTVSGTLMVWGRNSHGQLGYDSSSDQQQSSVPKTYKSPAMTTNEFVRVACGELHTTLLTLQGQVLAFGSNQFGQLGRLADKWSSMTLPIDLEPESPPVIQLACGRFHTLLLLSPASAVSASPHVLVFGDNSNGQLGINASASSSPTSMAIATMANQRCTSQPMFVAGPWITPTDDSTFSSRYSVSRIVTGGDHAFVFSQKLLSSESPAIIDDRLWDPMSPRSIVTLCGGRMLQLHQILSALPLPSPTTSARQEEEGNSSNSMGVAEQPPQRRQSDVDSLPVDRLFQFETVFSSIACLSASCLAEDHYKTSRRYCGVDLDAAFLFQRCLFRFLPPKRLYQIARKLIFDLLSSAPVNYPHIESLRFLLLLAVSDLCQVPENTGLSSSTNADTLSDHYRLTDLADWNKLLLTSTSVVGTTDAVAEESARKHPRHDFDLAAAASDESLTAPILGLAGIDNPGLVLHAFSVAVNKLDSAPSKILSEWLGKLRPRYLKRLIISLRNFITFTISVTGPSDQKKTRVREEHFRNSLELLKRLYLVNESAANPISFTAFQIPAIATHIDMSSTFTHWLQQTESGKVNFFSVCDYPFVFDTRTKAQLLRVEAHVRLLEEGRRLLGQLSPLAGLFPITDSTMATPFLQIEVRRDHLVEDALASLAGASRNDFKRTLRVKFRGEEAVDEGGVLKEFFLLIMRELLSPIYGMFRLYPESQMLWFNESTMEEGHVFHLVGLLCGLTVYNSVIIDLSFPLAMYRKLLNEKPSLDDLKELDPVFGQSLQQLLDYEGDDLEDVFSLDFTHSYDNFGQIKTVELVENGARLAVTQSNKALYVDKYVDHIFNASCAKPFESFANGVRFVCEGPAISFFRPAELQALVGGADVVDWSEMRRFTTYLGVYWDRHPVIEWFWDVFLNDFSLEQKRQFFRFLTGCDRISMFGFASNKISIQPMKSGDAFLPVAHTCANLLDLPIYTSRDILASKLALAIQQTEGFGLV